MTSRVRWPWQPAPGMVRVSHRKLTPLLLGALRAAELQAEIGQLSASNAQLQASGRASELLAERESALGAALTSPARAALLADLPVTAAGQLHDAAFVAWIDAQLWAGWSERLAVHDDQDDDTRRTS